MPPPNNNNNNRPGGRLGGSRSTGRPTDQKSNERNEYIPSFIAKKPFYIDDATASDSDYLEHQRLQSEKNHDPLATAQWYDRGLTKGPAATKYRKGACENCGSMSHKTKDCLQRKRKLGAKWTGKDIAADEVIKDVKLGWDAKRDRWNGFEAGEYQEVVDEFNALEELKKAATGAKKGTGSNEDEDEDGENGNADEGAKYDEETDMGRKQATSTRNLRLREDTAKYLINLDLDSAKYDPKTRSMVAPPDGDPSKILEGDEDGFYSKTAGDAGEFERAQQYAWETQERGDKNKIHIQANPTEALILRKRKAEEDLARQAAHKKALTDKYGSQEKMGIKTLRPGAGDGVNVGDITSNERYVEYDEHGRVKGLPAAERKEKSMYAEDVFMNNHTAVWGSWWKDFQWGYACCHSVLKNSFCTGEAGKEAVAAAENFGKGLMLEERVGGNEERPPEDEEGQVVAVSREDAWKDESRREKHVPNGVERDGSLNSKSTAARVDREDQDHDDEEARKRAKELRAAGISEAEMEKYRRERVDRNDPMAGLLGKDELVDV
jgi:pre-mRNA-processing factor SLU7